jgi:dual specificity protein kinase YAK1
MRWKKVCGANLSCCTCNLIGCFAELNNRASFIDFCQGLLNLNPIERWSPQQARQHPFITGEKFTRPFTVRNHRCYLVIHFAHASLQPGTQTPQQVTQTASPSSTTSTVGSDPKRPYGGLVPSQPKGTRAYQDAASYNHHLAQHQAYTAQAQAATQAANNAFRNPYINQQNSSQSSSSYAGPQDPSNPPFSSQQSHSQQQYVSSLYPFKHHVLIYPSPAGQLGVNTSVQQYPSQPSGTGAGGLTVPSNMGPAPPSNTYYGNNRGRANTINQMDAVPPALARLQHMNQDVIAGRNALTPVLNRDDAMREWERRQSGKQPTAQPYPQLEFLQQQAELAAASGLTNWSQAAASGRYQPPTSKLSHSYAPTIVIEDDRQNAVISNVRTAARPDGPSTNYSSSAVITSPPQAYASNSTTNNRYTSNYTQQQTPASSFDSLDRRADIGNMFAPMQAEHYQSYNNSAPSSATHQQQSQPRNIVPQQSAPPSFYGPGVANAVSQGQSNNGQQRNPFSATNNSQQQGQMGEGSRAGGMDVWPR